MAPLNSRCSVRVLIDVRSTALYARGRIAGDVNIPHAKTIGSRMAHYPAGTLFVVYCSGPLCNGAQRGAIRPARLPAAGEAHDRQHERLAR